jgi:hypothetical protein
MEISPVHKNIWDSMIQPVNFPTFKRFDEYGIRLICKLNEYR